MKRLTLAALFLVACGDDPSSNPGPIDPGPIDPEPTPAEALDAMFEAGCTRQTECGYPIFSAATTTEACLAIQRDATGDVPASLGDGAVVLDAKRLATCTEALEAASCLDLANLRLEIDPACSTYWRGTVAIGEDCAGGVVSDCVAGAYCKFEDACPGTCTATVARCVEGSCAADDYCGIDGRCMPRAAVGQACGFPVEGAVDENVCVDGAHCVEGVCAARLARDATCEGMVEHECSEGQYCGCLDESCTTRACVDVGGIGADCNFVGMCTSGLFCDFATGQCATRKDAGEACNESFGMCGPGLVCEAGTCTDPSGIETPILPLAEVGELCSGKLCPLGASCQCADDDCLHDEKVCTLGPGLGESCADALDADYTPFVCREGLCDLFGSLTCVQPAGPGEPCQGDQTLSCGSFLCLDGVCAELEQTRCDSLVEPNPGVVTLR